MFDRFWLLTLNPYIYIYIYSRWTALGGLLCYIPYIFPLLFPVWAAYYYYDSPLIPALPPSRSEPRGAAEEKMRAREKDPEDPQRSIKSQYKKLEDLLEKHNIKPNIMNDYQSLVINFNEIMNWKEENIIP